MRRFLPILALWLAWGSASQATGLLIPEDKTLPPLAIVNHLVEMQVNDQVVVTSVEQTFRNHTNRQLEATYVFPVPKGASVNKFTMVVNGKEVVGEMMKADKARQIYTEIVRRTQDPGLLEYLGRDLLRLRVFPILPKSDQKVTLSYTAVAPRDGQTVECIYPLKTDGKATRTLEKFSFKATIQSQQAIVNVYSPTHALSLQRANDHQVTIQFEKDQARLDKDFQFYYTLSDKDVGLTMLTYRPISSEDGHFMLLLSPRLEIAEKYQIPRDMVLVLDTSGSMAGEKMTQAKKALKHVLGNLRPEDRFGLINFSTTVNRYRDNLVAASTEYLDNAQQWVDNLRAAGGTAINDALLTALEMRGDDEGRTFTIVFFTDGQPTIGVTDPDKILNHVQKKNTANTRIFTFGVGEGDGINATLLDQLAEQTRALSTFVRSNEDIEVKVSSLYEKISHPVLSNLRLSVGEGIRLADVYPPQLPDLFHGGQVVALGRYSGKGHVAVKLSGTVGMETKEFVYEVHFPDKTNEDKGFVEHVWARRKVGYLLDQIRINGEKQELVDEVVALAKKYGITTPYTSYLIVPDGDMPLARSGKGDGATVPPGAPLPRPAALAPAEAGATPLPVADFARRVQNRPGDLQKNRGAFEEERLTKALEEAEKDGKGEARYAQVIKEAKEKKQTYDEALDALRRRDRQSVQTNKLGVELSVLNCNLRNQTRLEQTAQQVAYGRNCLEIGGVWIDEGFEATMNTITVKAQSDAYFRILERQPKMKEVLQLGNHLVWVAPNGDALVIDSHEGQETMTDAEIDRLFVAKK